MFSAHKCTRHRRQIEVEMRHPVPRHQIGVHLGRGLGDQTRMVFDVGLVRLQGRVPQRPGRHGRERQDGEDDEAETRHRC